MHTQERTDSGETQHERKDPEYHFQHCFPGEEELGFKWAVSVGKERISKTWMAIAVPNKGASGRFAADECLEFVDENADGHQSLTAKTDQEPSSQYLIL